ncbi:MAG: hypothetical protein ACTTGJ_04310, partial [Clostridium sp.]
AIIYMVVKVIINTKIVRGIYMLYILCRLVVVMTLSMLLIIVVSFIIENFRKIKFTPFKGNIIFIYALIMRGVIGILSLFLILIVVFYRFIH